MTDPTTTSKIPLKNDLTTAWALSVIVAMLMGVVSLGGLLFPEKIYASEALIQFFLPNDVVNLVIGLPILLGSMRLFRQGKLIGLLLWLGALLYVFYNYIAYLFGMPVSPITVVTLMTVLLSAIVMFVLLKTIDQKTVQEQLSGAVPEKIGGWVLVVFGILFLFRAVGMIAGANTNQAALPTSEIGVLIADLILSTLWIVGGVSLLRRMPLGYTSGLGLLFAGSMLFVGLIMFLLLKPILTDVPFALVDVIVVSIMGLFCFIPFSLFLRGVVSKGKPS